MNIIISNSSNSPIYEQIYTQIKGMIISEHLKEGQALPSMRSLAKDLKISVITTKKAYEELEKTGFIFTVVGKGSFVCKKNIEFIREENLKEIQHHLQKAVHIGKISGIEEKEIKEILNLILEEE